MNISSRRLQGVWSHLLSVSEKTSTEERDAFGFMKLKPLDVVIPYLIAEDKLSPSSAKNQAYQIIKYLKNESFIEDSITGFKLLKLDTEVKLPEEKKATPKEKRLVQILRRAIQEALADSKTSEQPQTMATDIKLEIKKKPDILVLIDTANFAKGCQAMNILMPIGMLFSQLARIGNVIATFAFYNQNCPNHILRLFVNHDCFLINCIDNKKGNSDNDAVQKGDWIDSWIERFSRTFITSLNFDVCVIVSGDHHFDPIQAKMRQYGRKVIRCVADENKRIVYLVGDCDTVTLKVQNKPSIRFSK